jgi:hypothetical protein
MNRPLSVLKFRLVNRCFALVLIVSLLVSSTYAYVYMQPKAVWPCRRVVMYSHLGSSPSLSDGSPSWDAVVNNAMALWNPYPGRVMLVSVPEPGGCSYNDGRNDICWRTEAQEPDLIDAVAITYRWINPLAERVREADLVVNSDLEWDSYRGPRCDDSGCRSAYDLRRVLLHELGHVLGLDHERRFPSIMYPSIANLDHLTSDDIAGARALYPRESTPPVATIGWPANGARLSTADILARGVARDNCLVVSVFYKLNANPYQRASNASAGSRMSWDAPLTLRPGRNVLRVYAVDKSANRSPVVSRIIYH